MNEVDKILLLELARDTIHSRFENRDEDFSDVLHLDDNKGAFVKLKKRGKLRGSAGIVNTGTPLYETIRKMTLRAAFEDPRQSPVKKKEVDSLKIEISLLGSIEQLEGEPDEYDEQIEIGRHGLLLKGGDGAKALLLPYHAKDNLYTQVQFLNSLAQKAGLTFNAWKDKTNKIYKFEAMTFSE